MKLLIKKVHRNVYEEIQTGEIFTYNKNISSPQWKRILKDNPKDITYDKDNNEYDIHRSYEIFLIGETKDDFYKFYKGKLQKLNQTIAIYDIFIHK